MLMDETLNDEFFRHIQSFFDSNSAIIVGSGLSSAEGIPGMWLLAEELINKVPELISESSFATWELIVNHLTDVEGRIKEDANLEAALLKHQPTEDIEFAIRKITTKTIKESETSLITSIFYEGRKLKFSSFINKFSIPSKGLAIITTNYDRLIEMACELEGIPVDNMFYGKNLSRLDEESSRMSFCYGTVQRGKSIQLKFSERVLIYKPHGCLSWYSYKGEPINSTFDLNLERLIVTPGANKYKAGYDSPFDIHRSKANSAIDKASKFIIIGYGFNDSHLETHLKNRIQSGVQTLIITRTLSESTKKVIDENYNVCALSFEEKDGKKGTKINYNHEQYFVPLKNWWDIENLVSEVF